MFCAISGEIPQEPVICCKTGCIFERRLIEQHLDDTAGKCPVTGEDMSLSDLITVKSSKVVKPRAPNATSVPALLALFQVEWDAMMLESYQLKQELDSVRKELANSLYQNDAACRVIARLVKERDEAKQALATIQPHAAPQDNGVAETEAMVVDEGSALSTDVLDKIDETCKALSKTRRKRPSPPDLASAADIGTYAVLKSKPKLHTSRITALDIHPDQTTIATGGQDKKIQIFCKDTHKTLQTLKKHSKAVTSVVFHTNDEMLFSASDDATVMIWKRDDDDKYALAHEVAVHSDAVVGVSLHPSGDFIASASADNTWAFMDIQGDVLAHVSCDDVTTGYSAIQFHPDGALLATGTKDGVVRIWQMSNQKNIANFKGHEGAIKSISFSENGYHLASVAEDGLLKLWDLRKLSNYETLDVSDINASMATYDFSSGYLAVCGDSLKVFKPKGLKELVAVEGFKKAITSAKFEMSAQYMALGTADGELKFCGIAPAQE